MYSNLVPFEEIVEAVKDGTGITNLRNLYPLVRRLIHRSQKEIGYGGSLLIKRIKYSVSDNTILIDSNKKYKVRLPNDLVSIETVGSCCEGLCPKDYRHQGNYLFLCKEIDEFHLVYYTLLCDGNGNPTVSENHFEAVVAGIKYFMYQPKIFNSTGNMNVYKELQVYYEDRIGEARGDDAMPSTREEWSLIAQQLKMSQRDILIYSPEQNCYSCIPESENSNFLTSQDNMVYYWQFEDLTTDITEAPNLNQEFLNTKEVEVVQTFIDGLVVNYSAVGRIAFAISNVSENYYQIIDVLENDITSVIFDTYYNSETKTQYYISKEVFAPSNIYYKLIKN